MGQGPSQAGVVAGAAVRLAWEERANRLACPARAGA